MNSFKKGQVYIGTIIASDKISEKIKTMFEKLLLEKDGYGECFLLEQSCILPPQIAFHTDLSFFSFGDGCIIVSPEYYQNFMEKFSPKGFDIKCGKIPGEKYPFDIAYNASLVGDILFCYIDYTEKSIINHAIKKGLKIINVTQGYAECSIVKVNFNAIITGDRQIHSAAENNGFDSLLVSNDAVSLDGYNNGFIGGASIKIGNKLCFTGDISAHKDYDKIKEFCHNHNVDLVYEKDEILYDYGSPYYLEDL